MVDPARELHRDLHAAARRDDRERRAAVDRARPRRQLQRPPVGDRRLRADPRGLRAGGGVAGRQGRPQARLHARAGGLHRFVAGLRAGSRPALPEPLARGAGDRRGDDVRHLAGADRAGVPGSRARDRARHLGRDHGRGGLDRAARGRCARGRAVVALDFPRERADRPGRARGRAAAVARVARPGRRRRRPPRRGAAVPRALPARLRADPRQRGGLGERPYRQLLRGLRTAARAVRGGGAPRRRPAARPLAVPQAGLHGRHDRRLRAGGVDLLDVPLHHALLPERAGLLAVRGGAPVAAGHRRRSCSSRR